MERHPSVIRLNVPSTNYNSNDGFALRRINLDRTGRTLGSVLQMGQNGTWESRVFCDPIMRTKPITFLELRAVAESIRSFAQHFRQRTRMKIREKHQAIVDILNAMASKSPQLLAEIWVLQKPLTQPGLSIESSYIPTAINRYAD